MRVPTRPIVFNLKMKNKIDTRHCQFFWIITDDTFMTSTPKGGGGVFVDSIVFNK